MVQTEDNLIAARGDLVRRYRISPLPWPDGIDSKWDRWYRPEEWLDDGTYLGLRPMPKRPEISLTTKSNDLDPPQTQPRSNKELERSEKEAFDKAAYQREYMRKKRAAEKELKK